MPNLAPADAKKSYTCEAEIAANYHQQECVNLRRRRRRRVQPSQPQPARQTAVKHRERRVRSRASLFLSFAPARSALPPSLEACAEHVGSQRHKGTGCPRGAPQAVRAAERQRLHVPRSGGRSGWSTARRSWEARTTKTVNGDASVSSEGQGRPPFAGCAQYEYCVRACITAICAVASCMATRSAQDRQELPQ